MASASYLIKKANYCMKAALLTIWLMVKEKNNQKTEANTKENLNKVINMAQEQSLIKISLSIKENLFGENIKAKVDCSQTLVFTRANSNKIKEKVKESLNGEMAAIIKETLQTINIQAMAFSLGQMEIATKVNGFKTDSMAKVR